MELTLPWKFVIAAVAIFGGWLIVGGFMWLMRKTVSWYMREITKQKTAPRKSTSISESFGMLELWIGSAERFIAIILTIWAPSNLAAFIGGWVALKFAANWQRIKSEEPAVRQGSLMALVGSVFSFTIAVGAALIIKPDAIAFFAK